MDLALSVDTVFCLAAYTEETNETASGFRPADLEIRTKGGAPLFGGVRLEGFASMLRIGFCDNLIMVGGGKYAGRDISESEIWCRMLIDDYGIDPDRVMRAESKPNTAGNIEAIAAHLSLMSSLSDRYALSSNLYHLSRAHAELSVFGLSSLPLFPAETFWLIEREGRAGLKDEIVSRLGGGGLAERITLETAGLAAKVLGRHFDLANR